MPDGLVGLDHRDSVNAFDFIRSIQMLRRGPNALGKLILTNRMDPLPLV